MLHVKLGRFVLSSQWRACAQHRVQHAHSALNQTTVVRRIAHMEEVLGGVLFERKQADFASRRSVSASPRRRRVSRAKSWRWRVLCMPSNVRIQARYVLHAVRRWLHRPQHIATSLSISSRTTTSSILQLARRMLRYAPARGPKAPASLRDARKTRLECLLQQRIRRAARLKSGLGVGMLPCFLGDAEPDLQRCLPPIAELDSQTWLVLREDLRHSSHARAFSDFISAYVRRLRGRFAGTAPVVRLA
jgi:DNA-binding transcriptional LysR family regulator